ncbi:MAG: ABC transporter ATP-binding protein [Pseudomonadota bacterium]
MLTIRFVRKTYPTPEGPLEVLRDVSLDLAEGETLALIGESGSGKSTLLHTIGGLEPIDSGQIILDGTEISAFGDRRASAFRRDRIGIVFQQFNLVSSLSVDQNVRLQARLSGRHDGTWITRLTRTLGLDGLAARYPEQLSGGQQQRVAIARALALRPDLVLADEPTGNLDAETGDKVMELLLELVGQTGCGLVMVTHNLRLAEMLSRQVRLIEGRIA